MRKILTILFVLAFTAINAQVYQNDPSYGRRGNRWIADSTQIIPSFCGTPTLGGSTVTNKPAIAYDSCNHVFYIYDPVYKTWNTISSNVALSQQDGLISGGIVTYSGSGLTYYVSSALYRLGGELYSSPSTSITLDAADPTYSRIDLFAVDTTGNAIKIPGVAASTPLTPQTNAYQIALTTGITLAPGATVPTGTTSTIIFDENTEWTPTSTATVNFANTSNPFHGTVDALISAYGRNSTITFTGTSQTRNTESVLRSFIYLNDANYSIQYRLYNGTTAVTNALTLNSTFGFNPGLYNVYQNVSIPLSAFSWSGQTYDKLVITMTGRGGTGTFYLDFISIEGGTTSIPPATDYSNKSDSTTTKKVNDSTYVVLDWVKGASYQRGDTIKINSSISTGGTGISSVTGVNGVQNVNDSTLQLDSNYLKTIVYDKGYIDSALTEKTNKTDSVTIKVHYPLISYNGDSLTVKVDSMPKLTYATGVDTGSISGRDLPTADWVLARVGSGGGSTGGGIAKAYAPLKVNAAGDSISQRYNILAYGADNTGTTDATAAIQAAINACDAGGGGEVFFPNGTYLISGALGASNSQLYIPVHNYLSTQRTHITLKGEGKPNFVPVGTGLSLAAAMPIAASPVVLKTTLTSGAAGAAVIGTSLPGGAGLYNENFLSVENIAIQIKNNPSGTGPVVGGINYKNGASLQCKNVAIYIDTSGYRSTLPTNDVTGIETPDNSSETFNNLENTLVVGLRTGYKLGEHVVMNQAQAMTCYYGINFKAGYHSSTSLRSGLFWCAYDIYVSGLITLSNFQFDSEWQQIGKWYDDVATIKDTANLATGQAYYTIIQANGGKNNSKFVKTGGANLNALSNDQGVNYLIKDTLALSDSSSTGFSRVRLFNDISSAGMTYYGSANAGGQGLTGNLYTYSSSGIVIGTDALVPSSGNHNIKFRTGGYTSTQDRMTIFSNGNVAIGQTTDSTTANVLIAGSNTPPYGLEIKKINPYIRLNSTTSKQATIFYAQNGTNKWQFGMDFGNNGTADFYIYDQANSKAREYINTSGDMYLGGDTYSSSQTLAILGLKANGSMTVLGTNQAAGSTGAKTINKPTGLVRFAAGSTTLVVTNSLVTTSSNIFLQVQGVDATALYARVTPSSGSFTITLNAAATAETAVSFWVIGTN